MLNNISKSIWVVSGGLGIQIQVCGLQILGLYIVLPK